MPITRQQIVDVALGWKGMKEKDGSFKPIVDIYNSIEPLPRELKLRYTDNWCSGFASAVYEQAGASNIFPCECNGALMIQRAMEYDTWIENDDYFPRIGDACLFDSMDKGFKDNREIPDNIGIVVSVDKKSRTFVIMICDTDREVKPKTLSVNGRYIRGFVSPVFDEDFIVPPSDEKVTTVADPKEDCSVMKTTDTTTIPVAAKTVVEDANPDIIIGRGVLSKVAAGTPLKLVNTPMYASATTRSISSYKSGIYYIWSVDTVNNRIRITNAKRHVGENGQITGWIDVNSAIGLIVKTPTILKNADEINVPVYKENAVYVTQIDDLPVYKGAGTRFERVKYTGLTANAKKFDRDKSGCLCKGVKVTCMESKTIGFNVWIRIPSGWIPAYYNGKYNVK